MDSALVVHRLHFAFTATFHYLFPQLTMGLAPLIVICKLLAIRQPERGYAEAARLLGRLFAINFVFGVVTGIPMEFQFGTNWARFSRFAGGVIGQTLAMEGMFAFFLESSFLGLFLFGEKRLSPRAHLLSAVAVFLGSWLSGYFIVATDAWIQHPVGYTLAPDGSVNWPAWGRCWSTGGPSGSTCTRWAARRSPAPFAVAGLGAYYHLRARPGDSFRMPTALLRVGVVACAVANLWQLFPSGDQQGRLVTDHQPATLAAMEGLFVTPPGGCRWS